MKVAKIVSIVLLFLLTACETTADEQQDKIELPVWQQPAGVECTGFELGPGKGEFAVWGIREPCKEYRAFFPEFLPALFKRTLVLERLEANCQLTWMFTGERGGFTIKIDNSKASFQKRFYDSFAFNEIRQGVRRHPEWQSPAKEILYAGQLAAITVSMDHKLGLSVALNGQTVLHKTWLLDVSQHQLRLTGCEGKVIGRMLRPVPQSAEVHIDPTKRRQVMMGFGGITTPTAYAQLSAEGKRLWWQLLCEYNLLIQREYPNGTKLNTNMDNWDRLEDATPHYYGDNFPNGEISDFDYIKTIRKLGGKVWFEFWDLPRWVGKDVEKYAEAVVNYCQTSKNKTGAPPEVVGIQNEKEQSIAVFQQMTLALRRKLDEAGFNNVRIHMCDHSYLRGAIARAKALHDSEEVWSAIDYSATHLYDYQDGFTNPDGFDKQLIQWKQLTADKPFLSTEICINKERYQVDSYRIALAMGQLYHKNLVLADAVALCYCWTLLNIVQPSYGYTRALFVPDKSRGFVPVPSSHQLRVFGAYSRRIREGMVRVEAKTDDERLLASAFAGADDTGTVVVLNRSTNPRQLNVWWAGMKFTEMEVVSPYYENQVQKAPAVVGEGAMEIVIEPGAIVTLTNVLLGRLSDDVDVVASEVMLMRTNEEK